MLRGSTGYKEDDQSGCENNQDAREAMAGSSIGLSWAYANRIVYTRNSGLLKPMGEVDVIKSTTSELIIKCLDKQFSRYGVPSTLTTDNGPNLVSAEMEEY